MKKIRLGESRRMNCGEIATIVKYNSAHDMTIKFEKTNELIECEYVDFRRRGIMSHFSPSVYEMGIIGLTSTVNEKGKQLDSYCCWVAMLSRCYSDKLHILQPTYLECNTCKEWLNYGSFAKWYNKNFYEIENQKMCLDKDILFKGNKVYSPETCVFAPNDINVLFTKHDAKRGNYPIGVTYLKKNNKYRARCKYGKGESIYLGQYNTPNEAFYIYKDYKEGVVKAIADKYKNKIPQNLYDAMYKYKVDITD